MDRFIVSLNFIKIFALLFGNFVLALGDFQVLDPNSKYAIVFQSSTDYLPTSKCPPALKIERFQLVASDPISACAVPPKPSVVDDLEGVATTKFLLLASDMNDGTGRNCTVRRKVCNAAKAGYAGIIIGTERVIRYNSQIKIAADGSINEIWKISENKWIDIHLTSPLDIKYLAERYAYPNRFHVLINITQCERLQTSVETCDEEAHLNDHARDLLLELEVRTYKKYLSIKGADKENVKPSGADFIHFKQHFIILLITTILTK